MIFGIGWHKTGTHSLQTALDILGFKGEHYPYWLYWDFISDEFDLKNLCSLTDFPVPLFYKELDNKFPNSKFILTTRNEEQWIESIEKHLILHDTPSNKFKGISERQYYIKKGIPIDEIHILAYGQVEFDRDIFLKRFREHNLAVQKYFKGRGDFIEINISEPTKWDSLCTFLGKSIPNVDFPHQYKFKTRTEKI